MVRKEIINKEMGNQEITKRQENYDYLLFLGCLIPTSLPYMEIAARKSLEILNIKLKETNDFACCPDPVGIKAMDEITWLSLGARNLCVAQKIGLDILTLCNGCYETLKETSHILKEQKETLEKVNRILSSVNKEYKGNIIVKHIAEVLYKEVGTSKISSVVRKPLKNLKVAAFYGCHVIRPSEIMEFDDPENPKILDELIEAIGCISVPRMQKMLCCGAPLLGVNMELSLEMAKNNLDYIKSSGADCIVTLCPFCQTQFDRNQAVIQRKFNIDYNLPAFYYPELLGLALGVHPENLGFNLHRVKVDQILEKFL